MPHSERNLSLYPNLIVDGSLVRNGNEATIEVATGLALTSKSRAYRTASFTLNAMSIAILAANDFIAVTILNLPNSNLQIFGAVIDIGTVTGTGGVDTVDNIDFSLGTAPITGTVFSETDVDNIILGAKNVASGKAKAATASAESNLFVAEGASNKVHLNLVDVISTDGTIVLTGTIDIHYLDLGRAVS